MADGDALLDDEVVLRRFNPGDEDHWSIPDDGAAPRLRTLAFIFNRSSDGTRMEVSVYQDRKLPALGIGRADCLNDDQQGWDIAVTTPKTVRALRRDQVPDQPNPFSLLEHAYPDGKIGAPLRDGAHAEIFHTLTGKPAARWESLIASAFRVDTLRSPTP